MRANSRIRKFGRGLVKPFGCWCNIFIYFADDKLFLGRNRSRALRLGERRTREHTGSVVNSYVIALPIPAPFPPLQQARWCRSRPPLPLRYPGETFRLCAGFAPRLSSVVVLFYATFSLCWKVRSSDIRSLNALNTASA